MANKPKFKWSKNKRAYLSGGKVVPNAKLRGWVQSAIDASKERIGEITDQFVDSEITGPAWAKAMKEEVATAHRAVFRLANGGKLDAAAETRLAKVLKAQNAYLKGFAKGLKDGSIPMDGKVSPRAQMYAQAARPSYENEVRARETAAGMKEEKRVLTAAESCRSVKGRTGCVEIAKKDWQPIGTLPGIGTAACITNCLCYFKFK
jgi:hypothetical protein